MHVRPSRRRWLSLSLPAAILSGFLFLTAGPAFGLEARLQVTLAQVQGKNVDVVKLRQQAEAARQQLRKATEKYQEGRQRLRDARQRLQQMRDELERTKTKLDKMSGPIGAIANASYQHSPVSGFASVFTSKDPRSTMRAAVDFAKLTRQQQAMLTQMAGLVSRKQQLVASARNLAERAEARAQQLGKQRQQLRKQSRRQTERLIEGLQKIGLNVSRGERLPIRCAPEQVSDLGYPNGLIPDEALCPLPQDGESLRADAAVAFAKLNVAYANRFGKPLCVTDSYRSLAAQQELYWSKPGLAAVPGTSNHGLGLAVDLCGGINAFGSTEFVWMKKHAPDYGWIHPEWAAAWGSRPEPWHWEYYETESQAAG